MPISMLTDAMFILDSFPLVGDEPLNCDCNSNFSREDPNPEAHVHTHA